MISVVVLAHNHAPYTRECLRNLLASQTDDFEVIAVDNGSMDETGAVLEEMRAAAAARGVAMTILSPGRNLGCSTARNLAVSRAAGDEVVFADNDTTFPDPAWMEKLRAVLREERDVAIVGPKLCYPFEPHCIQCAGVEVSRSGRVLFRGRGEPADDPRFNQRAAVQCLISACWMFRKSLYSEIGGLDEVYNPVQYEDLDFCYRARSHGYRVLYVPEAVVYHWESITSDRTPSLRNRYVIIKNGLTFKRRWRHMFEKEDGPPDDATRWRPLELRSLDGTPRIR